MKTVRNYLKSTLSRVESSKLINKVANNDIIDDFANKRLSWLFLTVYKIVYKTVSI